MKSNTILGVPFAGGTAEQLVDRALIGGLTVVPSGPGLAGDLVRNPDYRAALLGADLVIPDSGAMCLFWRLFNRGQIKRVSGLAFLKEFLARCEDLEPSQMFLVHPTEHQRNRNLTYLMAKGKYVMSCSNYVAPIYPSRNLVDPALFARLRLLLPKVVILGIGGGVQERLGHWLKKEYERIGLPCPAIICTGAAMGFLSGNQARIPDWADRFYLGWLIRCLKNPTTFIPRYIKALPLAWLILKYGKRLPVPNDTESSK